MRLDERPTRDRFAPLEMYASLLNIEKRTLLRFDVTGTHSSIARAQRVRAEVAHTRPTPTCGADHVACSPDMISANSIGIRRTLRKLFSSFGGVITVWPKTF